ncbi:hypothetical protein [Nostoc sp. ChiQUE01b]|uniref:hypothetical protein n=1 Tax=Nostoc sp. ChiQUE01b TaxID=3075376 RepID=UPI002AD48F85|nr:hypothetical protein [Nostoc sp. ChiQUE01b]
MVRVWRLNGERFRRGVGVCDDVRATLTHIASMQSLIQATLLISSISLLHVQAGTPRQASPL